MHNIMNNMPKIKDFDLESEYNEALKSESFKQIVKSLKKKDSELMKYTSLIEECSKEYDHCKECKSLFECKNKKEGYCYLPTNKEGNIEFTYKTCRYLNAINKKNKYQKNIKYFNTPDYVKEASLDKVYKTDKNRFDVINWLMDFLENYEKNRKGKGLYLSGNFGCGKTYLIAAIFNELAKSDIKSSIVFWPEFVRLAFNDDFSSMFEYIKKIDLLLIDDIGAELLTNYNRDEILCPLLQYRMDNNLSTFFTSNLNLKELAQHLSQSKTGVDEIKAQRIISRIEQLTISKEMISKNLRK